MSVALAMFGQLKCEGQAYEVMYLQDILRTSSSRDIRTEDGPWSIGPGDPSLGLRHRTDYGLRLIAFVIDVSTLRIVG